MGTDVRVGKMGTMREVWEEPKLWQQMMDDLCTGVHIRRAHGVDTIVFECPGVKRERDV